MYHCIFCPPGWKKRCGCCREVAVSEVSTLAGITKFKYLKKNEIDFGGI